MKAKTTPALLRLLARRSLALGLGCKTDACPHPEQRPAEKCPRLEKCIEELSATRAFAEAENA